MNVFIVYSSSFIVNLRSQYPIEKITNNMEEQKDQKDQVAETPFQCRHTPEFPMILAKLGCTVALSTFQAGKVILLSATPEGKLIQLIRSFKKPMGMSLRGEQILLATANEVMLFKNSRELAKYYPKARDTYDAMFMPRVSFYSGFLDLHDIAFGSDGIYAVNTLFSCLIKVDAQYSFTPIWSPPFITKLASEDRCHLNGMAMENGKPAYITAFGMGDTPRSWKSNLMETGFLMRVADNQIIADGLAMPHSPRLHGGYIYVLLSGTGEIIRIKTETGVRETVCTLDGFVRGMDFYGEFLFVGLSKIRQSSRAFGELPIADRTKYPGMAVVHLPTKTLVALAEYQTALEEIYDVCVLPNMRRANILNTEKPEYLMGLHTPQTTYWARKDEKPPVG